MKIKDKISIDSLYFGIKLPKMSYLSFDERNELKTYNLFDFPCVKFSVARWVTMKEEDKKRIGNPLSFLFCDVRGRCEYEFVVSPWPYEDNSKIEDFGRKVDIWTMYVEPNKELLLDLVSRVTPNSARIYLREERKRYRR